MIPFPLKWQLPDWPPKNEDERLYMQAFHCLAAASWRDAAARSTLSESSYTALRELKVPASNIVDMAMFAWQVADELIEGAIVYMQLRAELRTPAPIA